MLTSSTQLQNRSFHVVERTRTSSKCQKMKNARAKSAKILFFIVKYANLWGFCCRRRRGCLSSLLWAWKPLIKKYPTCFIYDYSAVPSRIESPCQNSLLSLLKLKSGSYTTGWLWEMLSADLWLCCQIHFALELSGCEPIALMDTNVYFGQHSCFGCCMPMSFICSALRSLHRSHNTTRWRVFWFLCLLWYALDS